MAESDYCEEYGFGSKKRKARLVSLGLTQADHKSALLLQNEVMGPHLDEIVDAFYDYLLKRPEFRKVIAKGFDVAILKKRKHFIF